MNPRIGLSYLNVNELLLDWEIVPLFILGIRD